MRAPDSSKSLINREISLIGGARFIRRFARIRGVQFDLRMVRLFPVFRECGQFFRGPCVRWVQPRSHPLSCR